MKQTAISEAMEIEKDTKASIGSSSSKTGSESSLHLKPVLPDSAGEGLPYAPENWPRPGDKWIWKVGNRFSSDGNFIDRYLYLPNTFRGTEYSIGNSRMFKSKQQVERYIQDKFPDQDLNDFFESFSWNVPAKAESFCDEFSLEDTSLPNDEVPHEIDVVEVRKFESPSKKRGISMNILSISSDYEAECRKLEHEIAEVLQKLKISQEAEYKLAEEKLTAQRIRVQNLYGQLDNERLALAQNTNIFGFLPEALIDKMDKIKSEVGKLRDMEEVALGFGKTPIEILQEHYGLDPEDY